MLQVKPPPKHLRLRQLLAQQVRAGVFPSDGQLPSERELMREHSVSYATVTRAIKDLEHAGLVRRVWGKGTFVASGNAPQANQLAITFGTLYDMNHPAIVQAMRGIDRASASSQLSKPWHLQLFPINGVLGPTGSSGSSSSLLAKLVEDRQIHGLVMLTPLTVEEVLWLERHGVPMVSVNFHYPTTAVQAMVEDSASAAWQVAEHIASLGISRVAMVMGPECDRSRRLIRSSCIYDQSLRYELEQRGISCESRFVWHGEYRWELARPTLESWLADPKSPTLWIFRDDVMARQMIEWAQAAGRRVPQDFQVIGFSDLYGAKGQMTSVNLGMEQYGRLAMQWLDRAAQGLSEPMQRVVLKTELKVRQSTQVDFPTDQDKGHSGR